MVTATDIDIPDSLTKSIRDNGHCILFAGSGIHAPPDDPQFDYPEAQRPPLGSALAVALAQETDYAKDMGIEDETSDSLRDLMRVSLYIDTHKDLGRNNLVEKLNVQLAGTDDTKKKPSKAVSDLAACPFSIIVTTNYDQLLEKALRDVGKEPHVIIYDKEWGKPTEDYPDPTTSEPLLFKMHGDLKRPESIVITDEDYITFVQRMAEKDSAHPVPETVRYRMRTWPTLFVGYSLKDFNLRLLFRTLRWKKDDSLSPKSFSIDHEPDRLIKKVWQDQDGIVAFLVSDLWAFSEELRKKVT